MDCDARAVALKESSLRDGEADLEDLHEGGRLALAPLFDAPVEGGRQLSLPRVERAPGVTGPRHTHPGIEIIQGFAGAGSVERDRREREPIVPGSVVRVDAGRVKSLRNDDAGEWFCGAGGAAPRARTSAAGVRGVEERRHVR